MSRETKQDAKTSWVSFFKEGGNRSARRPLKLGWDRLKFSPRTRFVTQAWLPKEYSTREFPDSQPSRYQVFAALSLSVKFRKGWKWNANSERDEWLRDNGVRLMRRAECAVTNKQGRCTYNTAFNTELSRIKQTYKKSNSATTHPCVAFCSLVR